jgi:hypothetical protein
MDHSHLSDETRRTINEVENMVTDYFNEEDHEELDDRNTSPYDDARRVQLVPIRPRRYPTYSVQNGEAEDDDSDTDNVSSSLDDLDDGRGFDAVYIDNDLLNMVTQSDDNGNGSQVNWKYNWQTKERTLPDPLKEASKATNTIQQSLVHLEKAAASLKSVPKNLKPPVLLDFQRILHHFLDNKDLTSRQLEGIVNALRFYWFPESVDHMRKGCYKSVRNPIAEKLHITREEADQLHCVTCMEHMDGVKVIPVMFRRRCEAIPFLRLKCDQQHCLCRLPSICLSCSLEHIMKNGFRERKSSVTCPSCRGELCIYDIQEIVLVVIDETIEQLKQKHLQQITALQEEIQKLKTSVLFHQTQNNQLH